MRISLSTLIILYILIVTLAISGVSLVLSNQVTEARLTTLESKVAYLETTQAQILKRIEWKYGLR